MATSPILAMLNDDE